MKVIFLLILSELSELLLKVKFILYILNELSSEFWKELINIIVYYGRNTEKVFKKG